MDNFTNKQKQIVKYSIELIAEKSIQNFTIKNLAAKLNVTEGAIYRHFKGKVDILLNILLAFQREVSRLLDNVCQDDLSAIEQIEKIFMHHCHYFTQNPAAAAVIFAESIFQNENVLSQEVYKLLRMHEKVLMCIIENGQKNSEITDEIEAKVLVRIIIGSIRYTVTQWRLSKYSYDLQPEGKLVLESLKKMIKKT